MCPWSEMKFSTESALDKEVQYQQEQDNQRGTEDTRTHQRACQGYQHVL